MRAWHWAMVGTKVGFVPHNADEGSPAQAAGIVLGSRILAVNGAQTETKTAVITALSDQTLGRSVVLSIELPDTELVLRSHRAQSCGEHILHRNKFRVGLGTHWLPAKW